MDRLTRRGQILMNNALNRGLVTRAQINAMTDPQIGILDELEDADVPVMLHRWFNGTPSADRVERTRAMVRTVASVRNTGRKRKSVSKRGKLFMRKSKRR